MPEEAPALVDGKVSVPVPGAARGFDVLVTMASSCAEVDAWLQRRVAGGSSVDPARLDWARAAWTVPGVAHTQPELFAADAGSGASGRPAGASSSSSSSSSRAPGASSAFWRDGGGDSAGAAAASSKAPAAAAPPPVLEFRDDITPGVGALMARDAPSASRPPVVGLDCEWRPSFRAGATARPIALLQLSWGRAVLLVPLLRLDGFPVSLRALLECGNVLKAGVGVQGDAVKLSRDYGVACRGVIDVAEVHIVATRAEEGGPAAAPVSEAKRAAATKELRARAGPPGGLLASPRVFAAAADFLAAGRKYQAVSLRAMTAAYCGVESWKSKRTTMSNWESFPLQRRQLEYASLDAWAGAAIADGLFSRGVLDAGMARALSTDIEAEAAGDAAKGRADALAQPVGSAADVGRGRPPADGKAKGKGHSSSRSEKRPAAGRPRGGSARRGRGGSPSAKRPRAPRQDALAQAEAMLGGAL